MRYQALLGAGIGLLCFARAAAAADSFKWIPQGSPMLPTDPDPTGEFFGYFLDVDGNTAIVGSLHHVIVSPSGGAGYIFHRTGGEWSPAAPPRFTTEEYVSFGYDVAVSGNTAMIGAVQTTIESATYQGFVHVYERSGGTWSEQAAGLTIAGEDRFGYSIALDGDTALVAGSYAVYVFVRTGDGWAQQGVPLVGSDLSPDDMGQVNVGLSGDRAVFYAPSANSDQGALYAFEREGETWTQYAGPFTPAQGPTSASSVSFSGDTFLIGYEDPLPDGEDEGAAYVYIREGDTWVQQGDALLPLGSEEGDMFGYSTAIDGDRAIVGAPHRTVDSVSQAGAAFAYHRNGDTWELEGPPLRIASPAAYDGLAVHLAISGDTIVMDGRGSDEVYAFVRVAELGSSCEQEGDCETGLCVDGVCCDTACDGACDACSEASGSETDGTCAPIASGSPGSPACESLACNGESAECEHCAEDSECTPGFFCNAESECAAERADGEACDEETDCAEAGCGLCASGHCVDGVCCDTACKDECQSCLADDKGKGDDGACGPITSRTDPDAECSDGSVCSDGVETIATCNGKGACEEETLECSPYDCDGKLCGESCSRDSDCTDGFVCVNDACVEPGPSCEDGETLIDDECVTPAVEQDDDGGCGCRVGPSREGPSAALWFITALAAFVRLIRSRNRQAACSRRE
jgi:MYXO-CTERM domain-containing protein